MNPSKSVHAGRTPGGSLYYIINERGYFKLYVDGEFFATADTFKEAMKEVKKI